MTIVGIAPLSFVPENELAVSLARYAQLLLDSECLFWGVNDGSTSGACNKIWNLEERIRLSRYLYKAQMEMERVIGFPPRKRWITEKKRLLSFPFRTEFSYIVALGQKVITEIELFSFGGALPVTYSNGIGTVTAIVNFTDIDEVRIFHPDTSIEIMPSAMSITGTTLTIEIPRCRLVKTEFMDNDAQGVIYEDDQYFEDEVDLKRYTTAGIAGEFISTHRCGISCQTNNCQDYRQTICGYIEAPKLGWVMTMPIAGASCYGRAHLLDLNYYAGIDTEDDPTLEDAIIRLAHSMMPTEPCGCDHIKKLWVRDRNIPESLSAEREANEFGLSDGAWAAWQYALSLRVRRSFSY